MTDIGNGGGVGSNGSTSIIESFGGSNYSANGGVKGITSPYTGGSGGSGGAGGGIYDGGSDGSNGGGRQGGTGQGQRTKALLKQTESCLQAAEVKSGANQPWRCRRRWNGKEVAETVTQVAAVVRMATGGSGIVMLRIKNQIINKGIVNR